MITYTDSTPTSRESRTTLARLLPRLHKAFPKEVDTAEWQAFEVRLDDHFPVLFDLLWRIYGPSYDFFFHVEAIVQTAAQSWLKRDADLKSLDAIREGHPHWYQSNRVVGAMAYVDLFSEDLAGLRDKIGYLNELGVTYLHLMPLFKSPPGDDDGGYAISSYREVDPEVGTMEDLKELSSELRRQGMSLVLGFCFQPHFRRTRMGDKRPERRRVLSKLLSNVSEPGRTRSIRADLASDLSRMPTPVHSPTVPVWGNGSGRPSTTFSGT